MKLQTLLSAVTASLCLLSFPARCDVAPDPMSGGISIVTPGKTNTEIALVHNTVKLQISPKLCKTRAFFRLRNTGPQTELEVGFPLIRDQNVADFTVFIDDERQAHEDRAEARKTPIGQPYTQRWKVWRMAFDEGQTRLVEVRYSNPPSLGYTLKLKLDTGFNFYPFYWEARTTGRDYDLADYGFAESAKLSELVTIKMVKYILITGSYWKGPIERCRVEADIQHLPTDSLIEIRPPAHSFSSRQVVWEWKNTDPVRNVDLVFLGGSPRQTVIPYLEKISAAHPEDEIVKTTLTQMKQHFLHTEKVLQREKDFVQR